MKYHKRLTDLKNSFYIVPAFVLIGLVYIFPIFRIIQNSFFQPILGTSGSSTSKFVWLGNYALIFKDDVFWSSIKHNIILFFICVPLLVGLSIVLSVLLYERMRGWQIYRTLVFIPYVLPIVVVGIAFGFMFQYKGVINGILDSVSLGSFKIDWLGRSLPAFNVLIFMIVWKELGLGVIIMLARLLSLDVSLMEAGELDGCNWWGVLTRIIIPQIKEVIFFYTILTTITIFTWLFNYVYVLTKGGPGNATNILELYIYNQGIMYHNKGVSSAVAVILLMIVVIVMLIPQLSFFRNKKGSI